MARLVALALSSIVSIASGTAAGADTAADAQACRAGRRDACRRAIEAMQKQRQGAPRFEELQRLLERACALGDGRACGDRADFLSDMAQVGLWRKRGCQAAAPDMQSCELYGKQLRQGAGVKKNLRQGTALLERACKGKAGGACRALAFANAKGPRYIPLLQQACDSGDTWISCVILGDAHAQGERVAKDAGRAKTFYAKACNTGLHSACAKADMQPPPARR